MGGLSIWHWLIVLVIVVLIFGTKKLRNIGQDLGGAVKGFKEGVKGADEPPRRPATRRAGAADPRQDDRRRSEEGNEPVVIRALRDCAVRARPARRHLRHVRHRLLRNRRDRGRGADRHRPRAPAQGRAHARAPVRPPAALRQRREVGHQPRDGARRAAQAEAARCRPPRATSSRRSRAPRATWRRASARSRRELNAGAAETRRRRPDPKPRACEPRRCPTSPAASSRTPRPRSLRASRRCPASTGSDVAPR